MTSYIPTSNLTEQVTRAVIDHLTAVGVGQQSPGSLPMLTAKAQPAKPDRIIAVTCYATLNAPQLPLSVLRVQLWVRGEPGDPFGADRIGDTAFPHLHDTSHAVWNGLEIAQVQHLSTALMGPDDTGRYARSDNYTLTTQRRSTP